ncbi:hypothetical protein CEUSTIGMA_g9294.t1 [Chlamydomonas eustigma]|uniref:Chlorophyll a-b binding protein, chloroplastic n=1 Tax=Chlamydomonas eustigma TaxID=1157962 RepID=A0A250XFQ6_9CHLO|nr:hypothetical protein CEUSTIGMA_g9294.t1 [Chlamydomonas eustigma]|eukprot:GAX81866.1 hypothetical protein CEUSTIGMA_g9294.t1 [Chlamydomonas eustigma]
MAFAVSSKASASTSRLQKASRSRTVNVRAALEPSYYPGTTRPAYLNGSMAGDYGFDPLGLGKDPEALRWYQQAELVHGRTAMTAVAGIVLPGLASKTGLVNIPQWYEAGKAYIESDGAIPFGPLLFVNFVLTHFVEVKRWQDFRKPKSQGEPGSFFGFESAFAFSGENGYPGGAFDPLKLASSPAAKDDYKLKEIKNGRLAMLAFMGFVAQYAATGKGPIDNLFDHLADPFHNNFAENKISLPFSL